MEKWIIRSRRLPFFPLLFSLYRRSYAKPFQMYLLSLGRQHELLMMDYRQILWVIEISWLTQKSFGLKPDWVLFRRLFSIRISKMASKTSFSKTFEYTGGNDIGRWLLTICLLSFLCTEKTLPFFQSPAKVQNFKKLWNIMRSGFVIDGQLSFKILTETSSWPWALFRSKGWITFSVFVITEINII